jgi:hypothetical protein
MHLAVYSPRVLIQTKSARKGDNATGGFVCNIEKIVSAFPSVMGLRIIVRRDNHRALQSFHRTRFIQSGYVMMNKDFEIAETTDDQSAPTCQDLVEPLSGQVWHCPNINTDSYTGREAGEGFL